MFAEPRRLMNPEFEASPGGAGQEGHWCVSQLHAFVASDLLPTWVSGSAPTVFDSLVDRRFWTCTGLCKLMLDSLLRDAVQVECYSLVKAWKWS